LEHLHDPSKALRDINKKLDKNGLCILTVPNGYGPFETEMRIWKILEKLKFLKIIRAIKKTALGKNGQEAAKKDTLNLESPHVQFFSLGKLKKMLDGAGLEIVGFENKIFLAGPFSDRIINKSRRLIDLNIKIADRLPHFLASGWMFAVERKDQTVKNNG
jgi:hypothetical protein